MSIIIHNISGDDFDVTGLNKYQVRINQKVIAEFEHTRSDGLAECLRKAAIAVEQPDRLENTNDKELLEFIIKTAHAF
jgi:hypothetical protein